MVKRINADTLNLDVMFSQCPRVFYSVSLPEIVHLLEMKRVGVIGIVPDEFQLVDNNLSDLSP